MVGGSNPSWPANLLDQMQNSVRMCTVEMIKDLIHFFNGVQEEFSRVVWPVKAELFGTTIVVLLLVVFFAVYVGAIDFMLNMVAAKIF